MATARKSNRMDEITNWRQWLADLPTDAKRELREYLDVSASILSRWSIGDRNPRAHAIQKLAIFNPELRADLEREFPDAFAAPEFDPHLEVKLYEDILSTLAIIAQALSARTIAAKVFAAMGKHLDPAATGLLIQPSLCVADEHGGVSHLHTLDGFDTGILRREPEPEYYDLGRDSLVGIAVMRHHFVLSTLYPQAGILAHRPGWQYNGKIASAGAFPLWRRGWLAGALFIGSVHENFFSEMVVELCGRYADVYALSLHDDQFYDPSRIDLRVMREDIVVPETNGAS
jgi:transcriptional regulator with XRE-family HTH domain